MRNRRRCRLSVLPNLVRGAAASTTVSPQTAATAGAGLGQSSEGAEEDKAGSPPPPLLLLHAVLILLSLPAVVPVPVLLSTPVPAETLAKLAKLGVLTPLVGVKEDRVGPGVGELQPAS